MHYLIKNLTYPEFQGLTHFLSIQHIEYDVSLCNVIARPKNLAEATTLKDFCLENVSQTVELNGLIRMLQKDLSPAEIQRLQEEKEDLEKQGY
ncbi:MAG TPA: hypothetical protein PKI61_00455 [bacterium]|mgnify:CR=1 FL=1|nr:hypothetical protein [bacterium]HPT29511.1 hypothetical protein [bacterium]